MPVVGLAEVLVQPVFKGTQRAISREIGPAAETAGRDAGSRMGRGMTTGLAAETAGFEAEVGRLAQSVSQAEEKVASSRERLTAASTAEDKALGNLRVAELKLQEVRASSNVKASQLAAAEEKVSAARARAAAMAVTREKAERSLTASTDAHARAQGDSAAASETLETHLQRVTTESERTNTSMGRLGATLSRAFRGRPLAGLVNSIRGDTNRVNLDMHAMARNVSQAGTRGGRAFTQAFMGISVVLAGLVPALGGLGAGLMGAVGNVLTLSASLLQLSSVAALIPAGLIAIGAGVGVMVAAFRGMGDALKAITEETSALGTGPDPRIAAMAIEDAQAAIVQAEENAADSRVDAARRVEDAKLALSDAVTAAAEAEKSAARAIEMARRSEAESARDVADAERDLVTARDEAAARVKEIARDAEAASRKAVDTGLAYKKAAAAYYDAQNDPNAGADRLLQLSNAVAKAKAADEDAKSSVESLRAEQTKATEEAKTGSEAVLQAERRLADARQSQLDAIQNRKDAEADAVKSQQDGARRVAEAQRAVEDAGKAAEKAQVSAARAVEQAHRNLERTQMQQADAASKAGEKSSQAMDKLTPAARTAVVALLAVYDQLGAIRRIAQENFFNGFAGPLLALAGTVMPQLATGVGAIASALGAGSQTLLTSIADALGGGVLESLLMGVATSIIIMNGAIDPLVQAFVTLGVVGMEYMPLLSGAVVDLAERFNGFIQGAAASGELNQWIDNGIQGLKDLGSIIGSVGGIFSALTAAAAAGGAVATLGGLADGLNRVQTIMEGPVFQTTMAKLFAGSEAGSQGLLAALGPIGEAFRVGADNLADFLRLGGEISGAFVGGIFTAMSDPTFGAGLTTFMEALQRGVDKLVPLMPGLTAAFGGLLETLAPLAEQLGPTLIEVFTGFASIVDTLAVAFSPLLLLLTDSPVVLGVLIGAFTATAGAAAVLTLAGNVQKIAMAGWAVASGIVKAALWLLRTSWVQTGIAAVVSGAQTAAIWLMYKVESALAAAAHVASAARVVGGWLLMAGAAIAQGALVVAGWVMTAASAVLNAGLAVVQGARVVASWVAMGGQAVAQAARVVASWVATAASAAVNAGASVIQGARVVGSWVLMGGQAMLQGARMAAAWVLAMGPLGWVIAAVVGIVAIIVANWDELKAATAKLPEAFDKAMAGIGKAWDKLGEIAKKPVKFVVETVIGGLVDTFNKIPGVDITKPKLPAGFKNGGYTGDGPADEIAGPAHRGEWYFTKKQTAAIGKDKLAEMARAASSGTKSNPAHAAVPGGGNMGGFFTGNSAAIARHGAYYLDVAPSLSKWNFPGAAKMWDGAAGIKVAIGRGSQQGYAKPLERGGGILGYATNNNIDMSPSWMNTLNAVQRQTVAAHEMGHAMGLPHNSGHSIMQPNLGQMASSPTAQDIVNLQYLYPGGSGKAGQGSGAEPVENPFSGLLDKLMKKFTDMFPEGGMVVDAVGGLAKSGLEKVTKWIQDIKDGIKNIAGDVVSSVKGFFGGGGATASPGMKPNLYDSGGVLPPGMSQVLNQTGKPEAILTNQQWNTMRQLAVRDGHDAGPRLVVEGNVYGDPMHIVDVMETKQRRTASLNNLRKVVMS
ncbi:matrixin family metalloprotease [Arthrobacter sp. Z1-15]